jgi:hypothetical protein
VTFGCLRSIPRIRWSAFFLSLAERDSCLHQRATNRVFGAEKLTGNLLETLALNDVFFVEQTFVFIGPILGKRNRISNLRAGAEKLGIECRWPTILNFQCCWITSNPKYEDALAYRRLELKRLALAIEETKLEKPARVELDLFNLKEPEPRLHVVE